VIAFVSKMERERADPAKAVEEITDILKVPAVPVQVPIGTEAEFRGVVDLFRMKAVIYKGDTGEFTLQEIPADLADEASSAREKLVESCAESDDALIEKFLEGTALTDEEIRDGFRAGVRRCGSSRSFTAQRCATSRSIRCSTSSTSPFPIPPTGGRSRGSTRRRRPPRSAPSPLPRRSRPGLQDDGGPVRGKALHLQDLLRYAHAGHVPAELEQGRGGADRPDPAAGREEAEGVGSASAGEIVAVAKFKETSTGDTLCDPKAPIVFERPTPWMRSSPSRSVRRRATTRTSWAAPSPG